MHDTQNIISVTGGYYPSPGIDFEVLGVKLDRAGVNSRRQGGGVGSFLYLGDYIIIVNGEYNSSYMSLSSRTIL